MALAAGTKLAHYEIVDPIGEGAMGVVIGVLSRAHAARVENPIRPTHPNPIELGAAAFNATFRYRTGLLTTDYRPARRELRRR